jgi:hypothetical protein
MLPSWSPECWSDAEHAVLVCRKVLDITHDVRSFLFEAPEGCVFRFDGAGLPLRPRVPQPAGRLGQAASGSGSSKSLKDERLSNWPNFRGDFVAGFASSIAGSSYAFAINSGSLRSCGFDGLP